MHELSAVTAIGGLFALCGISCVRNFLPTFVFLLVCRVLGESSLASSELAQFAHAVPPVLLGAPSLALFAGLSALELSANWSPMVRDLLSDQNWDQYTKPFYTLVVGLVIGAPAAEQIVEVASPEAVAAAASMTNAVALKVVAAVNAVATTAAEIAADTVSATNAAAGTVAAAAPAAVETAAAAAPAVVETAHKTVGASSWSVDIVLSCLGAAGTWLLCRIRGGISAAVDAVDPDNAFGLQSFWRFAEESSWVLFLIFALVVPLLALFAVLATAGIAYWAQRALKRLENSRGHACPSCNALVHGSALKCPNCHAEQPRPYRAVALMGIAGRDTVDENDPGAVQRHHETLVTQHRCPLCASPLKGNADTCDRCGADVWGQGMTRAQLVHRLDVRFAVLFGCGCLASAVPVIGFVLTALLINCSVLGILRAYDGRLGRFLGRLLFKVVKWSVLIVAVVFSSVPFAGVLLLLPYGCAYGMSRSRFLRGGTPEGTGKFRGTLAVAVALFAVAASGTGCSSAGDFGLMPVLGGKSADGAPVTNGRLRHADLLKGGELVFEMSDRR